MPKIIAYGITFIFSLIILNNFASYWSSANPSGNYAEGLKYAVLGGFGNTIYAEAAAIAAILGMLRGFLSMKSGSAVGAAGRLVGVLTLLASVIAIFANGVLAYLKIQPSDTGANIYVDILGSPVFEVAIIATLIIGFFIKSSSKLERV